MTQTLTGFDPATSPIQFRADRSGTVHVQVPLQPGDELLAGKYDLADTGLFRIRTLCRQLISRADIVAVAEFEDSRLCFGCHSAIGEQHEQRLFTHPVPETVR